MRLIFFIGISLLLVLLLSIDGSGRTIIVDDDGGEDFTKIQDAINASQDGDTIKVFKGKYHENIIINKSVSLFGNSSELTSIIQPDEGKFISITVENVTLAGFHIQSQFERNSYSVMIESNNVSILKNRISSLDSGIAASGSNNITISDNEISVRWYGITVSGSTHTYIQNNSILKCNRGVIILRSNNITIKSNIIIQNGAGLFFVSSNDCVIDSNLISKNDNGIFIWHPHEPLSFNLSIHANYLLGNIKSAIYSNGYSNDTFDARYNWWGDTSGPFHKTLNPNGSGDSITSGLRFRGYHKIR